MNPHPQATLLVVDDEESILQLVGEYFRRRGYRIFTAPDGSQALALLGRETVDCCFTDIHMPGMSGLELAERIHEIDSSLPVIVMTGHPSLETSIQTLKQGVVDFLIKPVDLKQMELSFQRVQRQRRIFMENLLLKQEVEGKDRLEALNRELLAKIDELATLNRIMGSFATTGTTSHVFQRAVDTAVDVVQADASQFFIIDASGGRLCRVAAAAKAGPTAPPAPERDDAPAELIMNVQADGLPLLVNGGGDAASGLPTGVNSWMAVPVKIRDKVLGVLTAAAMSGRAPFTAKELYYLSVTTQSAAGAVETLAVYENIYENLFATLYGFVNALEARDLYTRQHSSRVTDIALLLARELGCSAEELNVLNFAGPLHDIGKIGIRDDILLKPGRLTAEEYAKIKEHPVIGANMLNQLGLWDCERRIIRAHHERFDGAGYPDGLSRESIPFLARILSVADAYDAMASDRAYRNRMESRAILNILAENAGSQFDPRVVEAFTTLHGAGKILPAEQKG
ncbi:MAG: response regulator [Desulfobacterales bacterium]|jgi:putative nucleotidyltransferase with HDIG domain|nr:response regulator [Desulfobacterales bacterium]